MSVPKDWTGERVCKVCGKTFTAHHPSAKYCCDECRAIGKREAGRESRRKYYRKNRDKVLKYQADYKKKRYATDSEFRKLKLERQGRYDQSEKGQAVRRRYRETHAEEKKEYNRWYYRERRSEAESELRKICGFKGRCSDCPYDYCPE